MAGGPGQREQTLGKNALSVTASTWISNDDLANARRISPEQLLRRHFAEVRCERGGRTFIVPGLIRTDLRVDRWVACDWGGGGIGDNVALARYILGCGFVQAVQELVGTSADPRIALPAGGDVADRSGRPRLAPACHPERGRIYLIARGLSRTILAAAEQAGVIHYLRDGVAFVGRDTRGAVRAVTVRHYEPRSLADGTSIAKRDLRGSDKAFPVVVPGDLSRIVIVEGAISALAIQCLSELRGRVPPTVIATGGVNPLRWITEQQSPASAMVVGPLDVTIVAENELGSGGVLDAVKQARTDAARGKLVEALALARGGREPRLIYPPSDCSDAADWLVSLRARST